MITTDMFSRGFSDAIKACGARNKGVIIVSDARRSAINIRLSQAVSGWSHTNVDWVGILELEDGEVPDFVPLDELRKDKITAKTLRKLDKTALADKKSELERKHQKLDALRSQHALILEKLEAKQRGEFGDTVKVAASLGGFKSEANQKSLTELAPASPEKKGKASPEKKGKASPEKKGKVFEKKLSSRINALIKKLETLKAEQDNIWKDLQQIAEEILARNKAVHVAEADLVEDDVHNTLSKTQHRIVQYSPQTFLPELQTKKTLYTTTSIKSMVPSSKVDFAESMASEYSAYARSKTKEFRGELADLDDLTDDERMRSSKKLPLRSHVLDRLDSVAWVLVLCGIVIIDIIVMTTSAAEVGSSKGSKGSNGERGFQYAASLLYALDCLLRMYAMTPAEYFKSFYCWVDFSLSLFDVVDFVWRSSSSETAASKIGQYLVFGRLFRVLRLAKLVKLLHADTMPMTFAALFSARSMEQKLEPPPARSEAVVTKVMVVVGGGLRAQIDVLQAVRRHYEVVVLTGTGGLADKIGRHFKRQQMVSSLDQAVMTNEVESLDDFNASIDEIVQFGQLNFLHVCALTGDSVADVTRVVSSRLFGEERGRGEDQKHQPGERM